MTGSGAVKEKNGKTGQVPGGDHPVEFQAWHRLVSSSVETTPDSTERPGCSVRYTTPILNHLKPYWHITSYSRREYIFREGSAAQGVYAVLSGKVKMFRVYGDGRIMILSILGPGKVFGYADCLKGSSENGMSVQAVMPTVIGVVSCRQMSDLLATDRELMMGFVRLLAVDVAQLSTALVDLAYRHVSGRLAAFLLALRDVEGPRFGDRAGVATQLTREEIAEAIGTSAETAIRTLSQFEHQGLIRKTGDGGIAVVDEPGLRRLATA